MSPSTILSSITPGLRDPLLREYNEIVQRYLERRWGPSELSGGKFCEIVFTILDGYAKGSYSSKPKKPSNFIDACRALEKNSNVPRSFQILIPRMLPPLYEIRSNRNVGHVGGDVDPNQMDAHAVVTMCSWILAELIRVMHTTSVKEAQRAVDSITSRKIPLVWETESAKRVLNPKMILKDQILLLISSTTGPTKVDDLLGWIEYNDAGYFLKSLRKLHKDRFVELSKDEKKIELLPPGSIYIEKLVAKLG